MMYKIEEQKQLEENLKLLKAMEKQRAEWEEMERENAERTIIEQFKSEVEKMDEIKLVEEILECDTIQDIEDYVESLKSGECIIYVYNALEFYSKHYYEIQEVLFSALDEGLIIELPSIIDIERGVNMALELTGIKLDYLLAYIKEENDYE